MDNIRAEVSEAFAAAGVKVSAAALTKIARNMARICVAEGRETYLANLDDAVSLAAIVGIVV